MSVNIDYKTDSVVRAEKKKVHRHSFPESERKVAGHVRVDDIEQKRKCLKGTVCPEKKVKVSGLLKNISLCQSQQLESPEYHKIHVKSHSVESKHRHSSGKKNDTERSQKQNSSKSCPNRECQELRVYVKRLLEKLSRHGHFWKDTQKLLGHKKGNCEQINCQKPARTSLKRESQSVNPPSAVTPWPKEMPFRNGKILSERFLRHFSRCCLRCGKGGHEGSRCPTYKTKVDHFCETCRSGFHLICMAEINRVYNEEMEKSKPKRETTAKSLPPPHYSNSLFLSRQQPVTNPRHGPVLESYSAPKSSISAPISIPSKEKQETGSQRNVPVDSNIPVSNTVKVSVDSKSDKASQDSTDKKSAESTVLKEQPKKKKETEEERFYRMCKVHRSVDPKDFLKVSKVLHFWGLESYFENNKPQVLQEMAKNYEDWKVEQKIVMTEGSSDVGVKLKKEKGSQKEMKDLSQGIAFSVPEEEIVFITGYDIKIFCHFMLLSLTFFLSLISDPDFEFTRSGIISKVIFSNTIALFFSKYTNNTLNNLQFCWKLILKGLSISYHNVCY